LLCPLFILSIRPSSSLQSPVSLMHVSPSSLPHAVVHPLPLGAVKLEKGFWQPWQERNAAMTIPHGFRMLEESGTLNNMQIAADRTNLAQHKPDEFRGYVFQDSDLHKWLEAASLSLGDRPNAEVGAHIQEIISLLSAAQFPNGYLDSYFTFVKPDQQWTDL